MEEKTDIKLKDNAAQDDSLSVLHRLLTEENASADSALMDLDSPLEGYENEDDDEKKLELDYRNQFEVAFREADFQGLDDITDDNVGKHLTLDTLLKMDQNIIFKESDIDDSGMEANRNLEDKGENEKDDKIISSTNVQSAKLFNDKLNLDSVVDDQMLSPISLSPTPSSDESNAEASTKAKNEIRASETTPSKNGEKQDKVISRNIEFSKTIDRNSKPSKVIKCRPVKITQQPNIIKELQHNIISTKQDSVNNRKKEVTDQVSKPAYYTNEYTMKEVAKMKKRVIDSHRLILNFNVVKEGYARTCVQLKQSVIALKDSEIRRAHLMMENEELREELEMMKKKLEESTKTCTKGEGETDN